MFMNKVSVKDLFTNNNGRQQESSDSAVSSGSQNNYSQYPFSQLDDSQLTQDFGSQQSGESPSRKFYQRYASTAKAHIFSKESNQKQVQNSRSSQQLQINKTRAKERDERDILQNLVSSVKDCTAEVKGVVHLVNETLQDGTLKSEEKLHDYLEKVDTGLSKYNESLMQYLQSKDAMEKKVLGLTKEVAEKDGRIAELEKQLQNIKKEKYDKLLEGMEDIYKEHHNQLETCVQETTSEQQKALNLHTEQQEKYLQKLIQHNGSRTTMVMEQIKDKALALMDEKFEEGVATQMKAMKKELSREVQEEIYTLQCDHRKKIEELISAQVEQLRGVDVESKNDLIDKQKHQVHLLQTKLREDLDRLINDKVSSANMEQRSQIEIMVEQLWRQEKRRTDVQHQEQTKHFKEQIRQYYQQTLQELKHRHRRDMESIAAQQRANAEERDQYSRFYTSRRLPSRSYDSDTGDMDHYGPKSISYDQGSSFDRRLELLSPSSTFSRSKREYDYGKYRGKYENMYSSGDHPLSRSPALCNVVDPISLSPKPFPRPPGSKLDKLFSQPRPLSSTTSAAIMSPLSSISQGFNANMIFGNPVSSKSTPVMSTKLEIEVSEQNFEEIPTSGKSKSTRRKKGKGRAKKPVSRGKPKTKRNQANKTKSVNTCAREDSERYTNGNVSCEAEEKLKLQNKQHGRVTRRRDANNTNSNSAALNSTLGCCEVQNKTTKAKHIRFSPPMYGKGAHISQKNRLVKSSGIKQEDAKYKTRQHNRQEFDNSANLEALGKSPLGTFKRPGDYTRNFSHSADIFEFDDIPPSPSYLSSQSRNGNIDDMEAGSNDDRWQNARSIKPIQNSQIVTRKTYGRFNNGSSVSYQETVMTQVQDNVDGDLETMSQTSSPSMSVTELNIKRFYKTPPPKAHNYHDQWLVSHSPTRYLPSYSGVPTANDANEASKRQLRSRKKKSENDETSSEMVYLQSVKRPRKHKP